MHSLDHFAISVLDVDAAGERLERLGFQTLPLMRHIELGTSNRIVQLHYTYLEVVGHFESAPPQLRDYMMPRYEVGEGLSIVSLTCEDLEAEHERMCRSPWPPSPIVSARRRVTQPDGSEDETDSRCFYVWRSGRLYSTLFFTVHRKPETIWAPAYMRHPNTARRVRKLTYYSAEPQREADYVRTLLGTDPARDTPEWVVFHTPRGESIEFLDADKVRQSYADLAPPLAGDQPVMGIALTIEVHDPSSCMATLERNGVPFRAGEGMATVPAAHANGVVFEFRASA
jgi:hypothetical protein